MTNQHMGFDLSCGSIDIYTVLCVYMDRVCQLTSTRTQFLFKRGFVLKDKIEQSQQLCLGNSIIFSVNYSY